MLGIQEWLSRDEKLSRQITKVSKLRRHLHVYQKPILDPSKWTAGRHRPLWSIASRNVSEVTKSAASWCLALHASYAYCRQLDSEFSDFLEDLHDATGGFSPSNRPFQKGKWQMWYFFSWKKVCVQEKAEGWVWALPAQCICSVRFVRFGFDPSPYTKVYKGYMQGAEVTVKAESHSFSDKSS